MSNLSRSQKKPSSKKPSINGESLKTGLSAFQKMVATIASLLGIIISCITIMTFMNKDKENKPETKESTTTIIKEVPSQNTTVSETSSNQDENQTESSTSKADTATTNTDSTPTASTTVEVPAETNTVSSQ